MTTIKIITIACWIITALALVGLVVWFLTGSLFGGWGGRWSDILHFRFNTGGWEALTGPYEVVGTYKTDAAGIDSIKIDWVAGDVTLAPHDGNDIQITELAQRTLNDNEKCRIGTSGGVLTVSFTEHSIGSVNIPPKRLEVLVPRGLSEDLDNLTVNSVSGRINVDDVSAETLRINTTSGSIDASGSFNTIKLDSISGKITFNNSADGSDVDVNTTSGSFDITGAFKMVNADTVSGKVEITSTAVPSLLDVNTISGNVTITLPDDAPVSVHHSSVSGKLTSDIPVTMGGKDADVQISTVSGNTRIQALG